jgi:hypothetical protein
VTDVKVKDITNQIEGVRPESEEISNCDEAWDSQSPMVTVTLDTTEFVEGTTSVKIEIPENYNGVLASDLLDNLELDMIDTVKIRIKSTIPLGSGDLQLHLSENPGSISSLEVMDLIEAESDTWILMSLPVTNPKILLGIMSCGLYLTQDKEAFTVYVDVVKGYNSDYNIKASMINYFIEDSKRQVAGFLNLTSINSLDIENDIIRGAVILWAGGLVWNYIYDETSQDREGFNRGPYLIRQAREMLKQFNGEDEDGDKVAIPTATYKMDNYYG